MHVCIVKGNLREERIKNIATYTARVPTNTKGKNKTRNGFIIRWTIN